MTNHIRIIYLYIVAFITLTMIVGGISATVYNIANYIFPTSYIFFEEYNSQENASYNYNSLDDEISSTQKSSIKKQNYKRQKIKDSIVSIVVVIVGAIMYKYQKDFQLTA